LVQEYLPDKKISYKLIKKMLNRKHNLLVLIALYLNFVRGKKKTASKWFTALKMPAL